MKWQRKQGWDAKSYEKMREKNDVEDTASTNIELQIRLIYTMIIVKIWDTLLLIKVRVN